MEEVALQAEDAIYYSSEESSDEELSSSESDDISVSVPPLSPEEIDLIPTTIITEKLIEEYQRCTVCCEVFVLYELVNQLACGHIYHKDCIKTWFELHASCPICRERFAEDITGNDDEMSVESIQIEVIDDDHDGDHEEHND